MGVEVGRRVSGAAELALERGLPLVTVCASGGARMQEGVFSLFQMARVSEAFGRHREAGLFSVCVLTDPTYGGVSASFATLASVLVGERGAHVGFAGARVVERPTTLDYLRTAFDDFVELHGDRAFADDPAVVGGIAAIGGRTVVVIGQEKGHTVRDRVARNFGMPHPQGYRKALRLLDHAEAFGFPVVTLVDTPGAHPGPEAEERGQSHAIAETIMRSSRLRVPVVSVVTGEGC